MKKIFKKNQVVITALALMIAAAGYLSYTYSGIGDDKLEQASAELSDEDYDIVSKDTQVDAEIFTEEELDTKMDDSQNADGTEKTDGKKDKENGSSEKESDSSDNEAEQVKNPGETVLTSSKVSNVDFAVEAKLNREQVRSQNKEDLMKVINSTALSDTEKQAAVDKMVTLTDIAQRESDAEMLLEAKGFTDVVVNITDNAADVVLNMGDVTDAKRAQIEDIVKRKAKVAAENIVITPITTKKANK